MATLPELEDALRNADAAGDTAAARALADEIVRQRGAAPSQPAPRQPIDTSFADHLFEKPAAPAVNQGWNAPVFVGQQADRGLADIAGAPVDLMTGALNLGLWGADKLANIFGGNVDARIEKPFMGSDWIADKTAQGYEALGGKVVAPEEVSSGARVAGMGARGAAASLPLAFGLASGPVQALARETKDVAARAAAIGADAPQVGAGRQMVESLAKPYASEPGATLARDAAAGAGAGVGAGSYDEYMPDAVKNSFAGPFLKMLASLMGGVGGAGMASIAEGGAKAGVNAARNAVTGKGDPNAPVNELTGKPFTRTEMDRAAYVAQQMPTNKGQAVANIDENAKDFAQFASPKETPTVGMLADDIGMAQQENIMRTHDAKRFAERDALRRAAADRNLEQTAPKGANGRAFTEEATKQYDETMNAARSQVDEAAAREAAAREAIQRQNAELEGYRASQPQVSSAMAEDFNAARGAARSTKNAAYDAVDPKTVVDNGNAFLGEAVKRIDAEMPQAERMAGGAYADIANRVRALAAGEQPVTYGDLKAIRAQISEARKAAVTASGQSAAGSGADVQRLDQLGAIISRMADDINPEAARFYREEYAPRFKEGRAGEYGAAVDRSVRTGGESSATRPSEFGDKFLRKPEDAASLKRAMEPLPTDQKQIAGPGSGAPAAQPNLARNARDWMLGDLAKSGVLTDNAEIRYDRFRAWVDKNRATINQFPELAKEIDGELANAQRGGALSRQLGQEVAAARANLQTTQRDLQRSALQSAINKSPENAVASIMGSGDPETQMADMVKRLSGNQDALNGLKAATRDWIRDKAGTTAGIVGDPDAMRLSRANMEKLFNQHERTLALIYSPDEMNALRQAHKLLAAEAKLDVRTTAGSNSIDKSMAIQNQAARQKARMLEAALKAKFGVLKGGGVFRTISLFLEALPDGSRALDDILYEMQFNPDLAKHLLTRPVEDVGSPAWNAKLNSLLAVATGARESGKSPTGDDKLTSRQPLTLTVGRPRDSGTQDK